MSAAGIERAGDVDEIGRSVQGEPARPPLLQARQQALFAPSPNEPSAGGLGIAGWTQLP